MLLITSILVTLLVPRLPRLGAAQLDASAGRLASLTTYLADESSLRGRIYRLTIDLDDDSWVVETLRPWDEPTGDPHAAPREEPQQEWDPYGRAGRLPDGIVFESVASGDTERTSGRQSIWFLPEGAPEDVRVALAEDGGRKVEVLLEADVGHARVLAQETPR